MTPDSAEDADTGAASAADDLRARKRQARQTAQARRAGLQLAGGAAAADRLRRAWFARWPKPDGAVISGFWPFRSEIDTIPLLRALHEAGHEICLPVVIGPGRPLRFRRWRPGDRLVAGGFGVSAPPPDAPELVPDRLLVPLLAFDREGYRLGYGGGFYDRTLCRLRAGGRRVTAIGVGFASQQVDRVPRGPRDQRLDAVLTECGVTGFGG